MEDEYLFINLETGKATIIGPRGGSYIDLDYRLGRDTAVITRQALENQTQLNVRLGLLIMKSKTALTNHATLGYTGRLSSPQMVHDCLQTLRRFTIRSLLAKYGPLLVISLPKRKLLKNNMPLTS